MTVAAGTLGSFRLLRGASPRSIDALSPFCRTTTLRAGHPVFDAGAPSVDVILVTSGLVRLVRRSTSGTEATLGIFGPRDVVGLLAALEDEPYPADAEVVSRSASIVRIPSARLRDLADGDPEMLRGINAALLDHTHILWAKIDVLTAGTVEQRLAKLLRHLLSRFGDALDDGTLVLPIPLARRQLADMVGARVETVIRTMVRWSSSGRVTGSPRGFVIRSEDALAEVS